MERTKINRILENFQEGISFELAGRLLKKQVLSNFIFYKIQDDSGVIQCFVEKADINHKILELEHIYCIKGIAIKTKTWESSILVQEVRLLAGPTWETKKLSRNLQVSDRRAQRLLMNEWLRDTLFKKTQLVKYLREYLDLESYIEVDTPILQHRPIVGSAQPFVTHSRYLKQDLYLRGSCEIKLKQLIVSGYEKIFEFGKVFRNESESLIEFSLLEIQTAYANYIDATYLVENMIKYAAQKLSYSTMGIDFWKTWRRITIEEALKLYYRSDFNIQDKDQLSRELLQNEMICTGNLDLDRANIIQKLVGKYVKKHLTEPTFLLCYPKIVSPLAKSKSDNSKYAERWYLYMKNMKVCEVTSEENDSDLQSKAFSLQDTLSDVKNHVHKDLLFALSLWCPPFSGVWLHIDRLFSIMADVDLKHENINFFSI